MFLKVSFSDTKRILTNKKGAVFLWNKKSDLDFEVIATVRTGMLPDSHDRYEEQITVKRLGTSIELEGRPRESS